MAIWFSDNPIELDEVGSAGRGLDLEVGRNNGCSGFGDWMPPGVAQLTNHAANKLVISNLESKFFRRKITRQFVNIGFIAFQKDFSILSSLKMEQAK